MLSELTELYTLPALPELFPEDPQERDTDDYSTEVDILKIISNYLEVNEFKKLKSHDFTFMNFNIRGLTNNYDEFTSLISSFQSKLDVFILTESWLSNESYSSMEITSYKSHHTTRNQKKGGGVSIYVNSNYESEQVKEFSFIKSFIEVNTVKITINKLKYFIIGIYRPPNSDLNQFFVSLDHIIDKFKDKKVIFSGDLNINILKILNDEVPADLYNTFVSYGFYPTITRPTRINSKNIRNSSLIDHTWTNFNNHIDSFIILCEISDHFPTLSIFSSPKNGKNNEKVSINFRDEPDDLSTARFLENLESIDFGFVKNSNINIVDRFQNFDNTLFDCYTSVFPLKTKCTSRNRISKPWITSELLLTERSKISKKHELYKLHLEGVIPNETYKKYKSYITSELYKSKKAYFSKKLMETNGNMRKKWHFLNNVMKSNVDSDNIPACIENNNKSFSEPNAISSEFCSHFSTIGTKIQSETHPVKDPLSYLSSISHKGKFSFKVINVDEVVNVLMSLNNNKCNIYTIPNSLYKAAAYIIAKPLQTLFNESLSTGVFPSIYRISRTIPLHKGGCRKQLNNYRPISLLPTTSKLLEKIVNNQLVEYFTINSLFSEFQYGFRKNHSTQDINNVLLEKIYSELNAKSNIIVTFLDLKKAFDTVDIDLLIKKLKFYGLNDISLSWFSSYLKDRSMFVSLGNKYSSDPQPIFSSVPQGSVLGPTLFNIFINEFKFSSKATSYQYADDTSIINSHSDWKSLERETNLCHTETLNWLNANRLALNLLKTVYMVISNKKRVKLNILMNGVKLTQVSTYKMLGLVLDDRLNFSAHCKMVSNNLARINFFLYKHKYFLDLNTKMLLYHSLAYPHLTYNNILWGHAPAKYLNQVAVRQNKIIRNVSGCASATEGYSKIKILNIYQIHEHQSIIYMFKINNQICPLPVIRTISTNQHNHSYNTRFRNYINITSCSLSISQKAFSVTGPNFWNQLPPDIKNKNCTISTFSKNVKLYILELRN